MDSIQFDEEGHIIVNDSMSEELKQKIEMYNVQAAEMLDLKENLSTEDADIVDDDDEDDMDTADDMSTASESSNSVSDAELNDLNDMFN